MTFPETPEPLVDYLRAHRQAFTREVLTERLLEGGHASREIEAAWLRLADEDARAGQPGRSDRDLRFPEMALIGLVVLAYGYAISAALQMVSSTPGLFRASTPAEQAITYAYAGVMLGAAVLFVRSVWRRSMRPDRGASLFVAGSIAVVAWFGLSGLCVVGLGMV